MSPVTLTSHPADVLFHPADMLLQEHVELELVEGGAEPALPARPPPDQFNRETELSYQRCSTTLPHKFYSLEAVPNFE